MVLQAIRERLNGILAFFVLAILIIPFAFVGVGSYFNSDPVNVVARVNDATISVSDFSTSFQNYRRRMQAVMGDAFDAAEFDQPIVRRQHLDGLINRELLAQVSLQTGLSVDDMTLANAIRESEIFQVDGEFNQDVYQSRLASQGVTPQQYEADMRAQLILDQYPSAIAASAIATDRELEQVIRLQTQQRAFQAIIVPAELPAEPSEEELAADEDAESDAETESDSTADASSEATVVDGEVAEDAPEAADVTANPALPDEELLAWYEANQDDFLSPESVLIEYVELNAADMSGDIQPDEDQLLARFESQKARFITPEQRLASHILLEVDSGADEATIETVRQQAADLVRVARGGADFEELAREHSQDAGSATLGGDLGWIEPGFMVQAFEDALYQLNLDNPVSEPVQTGFGWHVILLRDIRPAEGMSFEEARQTLEAEFLVEETERRFLDQADRLVDLIYEDPTTLAAAADVLELEIKTAGPFGRTGGEGIAAIPEVVDTAFSDLVLTQGSVSDPVDLGDNHMVMLRLKEYFPEAVKPFDEVRDQVAAAVQRDRALNAARQRAEELLAAIEGGEDMTAVAETAGLELLQDEAAQRTNQSLPRPLRDRLFRMPAPAEGEVVRELVQLDDGIAIVQLQEVRDGELEDGSELIRQAFQRRIANATANSETFGFLRMLREQSEIEIYEDRL